MSLTVTAFLTADGTQVDIFPTYEWFTKTKPKGKDSFAYATSSSYSAVSGKKSNIIWYRLTTDETWQNSGSATYTTASLYGYKHTGSTLGSPAYSVYIKGCFYYRVDIDSTSPVKKIVMTYVQDTTSGTSLSYSLSIGPLSASVETSSSNVKSLSDVYNLKY